MKRVAELSLIPLGASWPSSCLRPAQRVTDPGGAEHEGLGLLDLVLVHPHLNLTPGLGLEAELTEYPGLTVFVLIIDISIIYDL